MAIVYPLALPTVGGLKRITFRDRTAVSSSRSPFTFSEQVFVHRGDMWGAMLEFTDMDRADAEEWIAWRLALNGREGTFLIGDPVNTTPRGTWAGSSPVLVGAHAAGVKMLEIGAVNGLTWKRGDWLQLGSGSSSRLHKVTQDGVQAGSPSVGFVEIWPRTRSAYLDGAAITLASPKGLFCQAANNGEWTLDPDSSYMLPPLQVEEVLRA